MSSNSNGKKKTAESNDEVDELLRAAQDDMLLKLSLNSHMAHSPQFSAIDPDLDSRFQTLKTHKPISKSKLDAATTGIGSEKKNPEKVLKNIDQSDDLFARFSALRGSLHSYSSSSDAVVGNNQLQQQQQLVEDDGEEDEVEKVIKWAIDAARLDPSPPSDIDDQDDGDDDDDDDDDSDDEDDDHGVGAGKKSKRK